MKRGGGVLARECLPKRDENKACDFAVVDTGSLGFV
jgi:hypothetical protein